MPEWMDNLYQAPKELQGAFDVLQTQVGSKHFVAQLLL
jgi:hypothetical protein